MHPAIFGGILSRQDQESDLKQIAEYNIQAFDLVIVDLYPFEKTVASGANEEEIIEKIDIGGISLIRAAAKNFKDVLVVSSMNQYTELAEILKSNNCSCNLDTRKKYAGHAFRISSHYDTAIFKYFNDDPLNSFNESICEKKTLRYGENPHQKGVFFGKLEDLFEQIHGKEISYNNLLDIEAAVGLMAEFNETSFAILKHNNACGIASRLNLKEAWKAALAGDPVSAYGGILITNEKINEDCAAEIHKIFFEVVIAPAYSEEALDILKQKKNRIILIQKENKLPDLQFRSLLNGVIAQEKDATSETKTEMSPVTKKEPDVSQYEDLEFALKLVKHTKSNTIVLAKGKQLLASGVGQTSRVDALKQAIEKAGNFNFSLDGAVMASDAFFPFKDSVEIAHKAGITAVIQPGGSVRDQETIDFCNDNNMAMVFTGVRHFKH